MPSTPKQELTLNQQRVLDYIVDRQRRDGFPPTTREIQQALGFKHQNSVAQFVKSLRHKGYIHTSPEGARRPITLSSSASSVGALVNERSLFIDVPMRGDIQAGVPAEALPQYGITLLVDAKSMGLTEQSRPYALRARGTSMIGRGILDGDYIVLDETREPRSGDVVAALLDGEATLKTLVKEGNTVYLKAENPAVSVPKPKRQLQVQGVMVGLIRTELDKAA